MNRYTKTLKQVNIVVCISQNIYAVNINSIQKIMLIARKICKV